MQGRPDLWLRLVIPNLQYAPGRLHQLEWLSSTTAMIVLFWSKATRDLLRSFGWGIAALHR
jgi:hypothetical protein